MRFDVIWSPRLCCFCVAGVGIAGTAVGLMYALALFGLRRCAAAFARQAWDLVHLQGSDVRFGVVWSPPFCCAFAWQAWDLEHLQWV